jgi:hypothetical protein
MRNTAEASDVNFAGDVNFADSGISPLKDKRWWSLQDAL